MNNRAKAPVRVDNANGTTSWRIRFFDADGKRQSRTFTSEAVATDALARINEERERTIAQSSAFPLQALGDVRALKVSGIHENQGETTLLFDTLPRDSDEQFRTYEIAINGRTWGVWLQLLGEAADPLDVWQFNPETDIEENGAPF